MNSSRHLRPVHASPPAAPVSAFRFCAICQVSVARAEVESGEARQTPKGRTFCGVCTRSTPEERRLRREALEAEFADDAPVAIGGRVPEAHDAPPPLPVPAEDTILALRVGELERAAFRMNARVTTLEERLAEALRRLG